MKRLVILIIFLLFIPQVGFAYIYSVIGTNDSGDRIHGEVVALGFDHITVQGFIYKKNNREVYFVGKWKTNKTIQAYDDDGNYLTLKPSIFGFGVTEKQRTINAYKYLINYFEEALISIPRYAGSEGKIRLVRDRFLAFVSGHPSGNLYKYDSTIRKISVAATNYRIVMEMPGKRRSIKRIKSYLNHDCWGNNPQISASVIRSSLQIFKAWLKIDVND